MSVQALLERARENGLTVFLEDGRVQVKAAQKPQGEAQALINELREHKEEIKLLIRVEEPPIRAWVIQEVRDDSSGKLRAVLICSALVHDDFWVIWDRSFEPRDNLVIYFGEELSLLKSKTPEEIVKIHEYKLEFPQCRLIQEAAEKPNPEQGKLDVVG